jgi:hypothetical protein
MNDDASGQRPKLQMKMSGSPPKPPKKTTTGLADNPEPSGPDLSSEEIKIIALIARTWINLLDVQCGTARPRICESLETDLDEDILLLSRGLDKLHSETYTSAMTCLCAVRDYRRKKPRKNPSTPIQAKQAEKVLKQIFTEVP